MPDNNWNEWFKGKLEEQRVQDAARIAQAKADAAARGKEPFDLDKFEATYVASSAPSRWVGQERVRELERRYYLQFPEVMTVEAFARAVEANDVHEGGDMHVESRLEQEAETERAIQEATARGKEPFDLAKLDRLYDTKKGRYEPRGTFAYDEAKNAHVERRSREARRIWEHAYYVLHSEVMTIEEFAAALAELERG